MEVECIPFVKTGYFSKIIADYLAESDSIKEFYEYSPQLASFATAIENKKTTLETRSVLSAAIDSQYKTAELKLEKYEAVSRNIALLKEENTFTVTTGHQLCLFTGPLYFIYKIVSTINLCKQLKAIHPDKEFVPIYWMATEDHDLAEVNHFYFKGEKITWNTKQTGAVGRMNLEGMDDVFEEFSMYLVDYSNHAEQLKTLFRNAYLKHNNLADATRYLVNELFHEQGLVIIDGDDSDLKSLFVPIMEAELKLEISSKKVDETSAKLSKQYKIQVNPREINLFYLKGDTRNRIVKSGDFYEVNETTIRFTEEEIFEELKNKPENFSPNVILRPIYEEFILPNLAYIGGGGELAYWFQLKSTFDFFSIPMPMLLLRNSVMWMDNKQHNFFKSLNLSLEDLFEPQGDLTKKWVIASTKEDLTLAQEKAAIESVYTALASKLAAIDSSLSEHLKAKQTKHLNDLDQVSEKYIRTVRKQAEVETRKINYLKTTLYPNGGLQERKDNFSNVYIALGAEMIELLLGELKLPTSDFTVFKA